MEGLEYLLTPQSDPLNWQNQIMHPYALQDGILCMEINRIMCTYNIKTGKINDLCSFTKLHAGGIAATIVIPYFKSLLPVQEKTS
ncbi:hypothetical protein FRX31_026557 [Thalictrum thalictroides]|uniref:Uncharacterized protein n=1 Tax=Thalictrum thalictroides TaxID=46969 RepID=A0A7J6VFE6_THATH|nr:hypothetical protein FRX31_026557 [Thalictrum thalictroides]